VEQARAGSQDAFAQLYQTYLPQLYYLIHKHTHFDRDTADLVQETFTYALVKLDDLKDPAAFRPWLFRIALSKATDASRSTSRHIQDVALDALSPDENATFESLPALTVELTPEVVHEQHETHSALLHYIDQLTSAQKDVVILHYYVGFSAATVAELLGLSPEAVRKRLHDALVALRSLTARMSSEDVLAVFSGSCAGDEKSEKAAITSENSHVLIKRLLAEDRQACVSDAEKEVTPQLSVALSALVATGGLNAATVNRVQAFLVGLNKGAAPVTPASTHPAPAHHAAWGKGVAVMAGCALAVAVLGSGAYVLWHTNQGAGPAITHTHKTTQEAVQAKVAAPAETSQTEATDTQEAAGTGSSNQSAGAGGANAAQPQAQRVVAEAPATPSQQSVPSQGSGKTAAPSATSGSGSSTVPAPLISVASTTLSYPLGTSVTEAQLLADAQASAQTAAGASVPVTVAGLSNINVDHAGTYLVFLNARDDSGQTALPQVLSVVIE